MIKEEFIKKAQIYYYCKESEFMPIAELEIIFNFMEDDIKILCIKNKINEGIDILFHEFVYLENNLNLLKNYFFSLLSLGDELHKSWFEKAKLETQLLWYSILKKDYEDEDDLEYFANHWISNWYKIIWRDKQIDSILKDE
jgi:hypothetical protein